MSPDVTPQEALRSIGRAGALLQQAADELLLVLQRIDRRVEGLERVRQVAEWTYARDADGEQFVIVGQRDGAVLGSQFDARRNAWRDVVPVGAFPLPWTAIGAPDRRHPDDPYVVP